MEVELKLSARAADVSALKRALVEMAPGSVSSEERLISTYYDTRDLALKRQGLTLRVREQAGRFIQTVKTDAVTGADMLSRGEWEDVVAENRPDPRATQSGARLPEGVGDDLWPLFVTEVKRTSVVIEPTVETEIEVSIDEGEIRGAASDRVEPISEIELELKRGDAAALYDLALELLEGAPLRFEMRSKAERGYRLVEGAEAAPAEVHAEPVPLDDTMSVESALQKIGRGCLAQLLRNEAAVLSGQAEGVHQMRIAVRRLRSAMSAVKKMLSAEDYRWTSGELARLAGALGPARDLDTFETALLEPARDALADEPGLDDLATAIEGSRRVAYDRVREEILSARYTPAMLRLLRWFDGHTLRRQPTSGSGALLASPIREIAPRLLDRRRRRVRRRSKGFAQITPQQRHKLRIAAKKLRYTIELFESLFDQDDLHKFVSRLKRLQDDLGYANDVRVGHELLTELTARAPRASSVAGAGARVLAWHDQVLAEGERKLHKRLRRLNHARPFWRSRQPVETRAQTRA